MTLRCLVLASFLLLAACTAGETFGLPAGGTRSSWPTPTNRSAETPTIAPTPAAAAPTPNLGTVTGDLCYPSSENPPMTLFLENINNGSSVSLNIARGQTTYESELPVGQYVAYARTVGMNLRGDYTCDSAEPCTFQVEPGQVTNIDICTWYTPPGIWPPAAEQADDEVFVRLLQNMHARTGPHLSFPELGLLEAGSLLRAEQLSADGEWIQVKHPELQVTGWLHAPLTQILGDPKILPIDPEAPLSGLETLQFMPAIWRPAANADIVHFKGSIRDGAGRPVNGYSVLLDNGTWSVLSHPSGASHHYPDISDGLWDVVVANETDAAGWWTLTVVRYECPDFETGFNAQCKQYTPLSETKVVHAIHPDENVIEANWTCLEDCDQGLYIKPYRHPLEPINNSWLLYVEDRSLKSSPVSPVFDREELRTIYDELPDTPDGLQAYLAENRPLRSSDGQHLLVNAPSDVTWLANLETGDLHQISRPAVQPAWCPDCKKLAYFRDDTLYVFDVESFEAKAIWRQGLKDARVSWPADIVVKTDQAAWHFSPDGRLLKVKMTEPGRSTPSIDDYLDTAELPPITAWALSHNEQRIALNVNLGHPLRNAIILYDIASETHFVVGPINGYRVPEIRWTPRDELLLIGATNPKFPSGGAIFTFLPEEDLLPEVLLESDTAYLVDIIKK